jgi:hypothetical protein
MSFHASHLFAHDLSENLVPIFGIVLYKERPARQIVTNWCLSVLWQDIAHLISDYGLLVVAVVIGLESIGLPFPGESVLILAGIFAGTRHDLNIVWVVVVAAVAAIVGQAIGYVIGR